LLVTIDTKPHRVIHFSLCDRLLPHVAMTDRTIDPGADVRCVIEFHVRRRLKTIDPLPGNVLTPRAVCGKLLNLWLVRRDYLMAGHAETNARNSGVGALIHSDMAIGALHAVGEVHFVRVGNRLDGFGAKVKELPDGIRDGGMRRGENVGVVPLKRPAGFLRRQKPSPKVTSQHDHAQCNRDAGIMV